MSKDILQTIENNGFNKVRVAITDIDGVMRGKEIHLSKFASALEDGFGFCNVIFGWDSSDECYENDVEYTGWHTGYPDALAKIDIDTYRNVPWNDDVPFFLADFEDGKGNPLAICPRQVLKKAIGKANEMGFSANLGYEFEWFNFNETPQSWADKGYENPEPMTPGMFGYSLLRMSQNQDFFSAIFDELMDFGIPIEGIHTETGPGVYEAAILYSDALEAADRATLFKTSVKQIALQFEVMASFMAKWDDSLPGCGGHIHQSLQDKEGNNVFYDESDDAKMSKIFKQYVAGQLHCLPQILPFFAPTTNSYKRLVEGMWAPTTALWAIENRTTALRVIPGSSKSTRLETRVPGSDINSYLAGAAAIASGLYGIENEMELTDKPVVGNGYAVEGATKFPKDLNEATQRLADSEVARNIFGDEFIDHFVKTRQWEWKMYKKGAGDPNWEMKRYFEII